MAGVVRHPNDQIAFALDEAVLAEDLGLDAKAPDLAEWGIFLFAGGHFYRNLVNEPGIADGKLKFFPDREREHPNSVNCRDHVVHLVAYLGGDLARRPVRVLWVGLCEP